MSAPKYPRMRTWAWYVPEDSPPSSYDIDATRWDSRSSKEGAPVSGATKVAGDLAEEGAEERDEELLNSLEEQLAAHREQAESETEANDTEGVEDAETSDIDTTRVTDDSEDEGKHRLEGDEK